MKQLCELIAHPHRANRKSATEPLRHADCVRRDARVLEGIEPPGPLDAALHFVDQEEQVVFIAELPDAAQKFGRAWIDSTFALDRLEKNRRGAGIDQLGETLDLVDLAERESR